MTILPLSVSYVPESGSGRGLDLKSHPLGIRLSEKRWGPAASWGQVSPSSQGKRSGIFKNFLTQMSAGPLLPRSGYRGRVVPTAGGLPLLPLALPVQLILKPLLVHPPQPQLSPWRGLRHLPQRCELVAPLGELLLDGSTSSPASGSISPGEHRCQNGHLLVEIFSRSVVVVCLRFTWSMGAMILSIAFSRFL